jgi:hypothetical protein
MKRKTDNSQRAKQPRIKLWLDDRRPAPSGWIHAFTIAGAQDLLRTGLVDEASLDHDLGACEACMAGQTLNEWLDTHNYDMPTCEHVGTGLTLCLWMERTGCWPAKVPVVHSMNHDGANRMLEVIARAFPKRPK